MSKRLRSAYFVLRRFFTFAQDCFRPRYRGMLYYAGARRRGLPLAEKTVLFEAYRAVKIADNPYALFQAMIDDSDFAEFTFVWAIDDRANPYRKKYASRRNVRFVSIHSRAYSIALFTSKYLVNNKAWPFYFAKRPGQVHVTTWHATAFKGLGKEQGGTMGQFRNVSRNYLHADYLVMPNRFTSEVMLRSNDVEGIFPGLVVEDGYPRVDLTVNTSREEALALLRHACAVDADKRIVLYAPTWRGETADSRDTTDESIDHITDLIAGVPDGYELLLKVHDLTYEYLAARDDLAGIKCVPDWVDANELLPAVDVLVTDYSSIFFDYLVLDRPIIFFDYDLEEYAASRGLYFDVSELPGPVCSTSAEVVDVIGRLDESGAEYAPMRAAMRAVYCGRDDGHASERVRDIVFKGASSEHTYHSLDDTKTRVLVVGCAFDHTPQTFEIINLANHLDHSKYDLTVLHGAASTPERERHLRMLDPRVRVFFKRGFFTETFSEYRARERNRTLEPAIRCSPAEVALVAAAYEEHKRNLLAETRFDVALCLTDELNDWTYLASVCAFERRLLWLTDANADAKKRLPADFVMDRFDAVLFTPQVAEARLIREIRAREKGSSAAGSTASILKPTERFEGYDESIRAFGREEAAQLEARLSALLAEGEHADGQEQDGAVRERLREAFEKGIASLMRSLHVHLVEQQETHGFDHVAHNQAIMDRFYEEVGGPSASTTP